MNKPFVYVIAGTLFLTACGELPHRSSGNGQRYELTHDRAPDVVPSAALLDAVPNAVPKNEPLSKYGNPETYEVFGQRYRVMKSRVGFTEKGDASWYGLKFHGKRTSSGEAYDMYAMTAAHKTLPLPTYVEVTNLDNNKKVVVKVNDRGPFHEGRIIDLSYAAAHKLEILQQGTGRVSIRAIDPAGYEVAPETQVVAEPMPLDESEMILAKTDLYIQVGAYQDKKNFQAALSKLLESEMADVQIKLNKELPKVIYRLRVGPLSSMDQANQITDSLKQLGFTPSSVIVD